MMEYRESKQDRIEKAKLDRIARRQFEEQDAKQQATPYSFTQVGTVHKYIEFRVLHRPSKQTCIVLFDTETGSYVAEQGGMYYETIYDVADSMEWG